MKRYGTVLTFAPGVTLLRAGSALRKFAEANPGLLAEDAIVTDNDNPKGYRTVAFRVEQYDDTRGGPVWYIP